MATLAGSAGGIPSDSATKAGKNIAVKRQNGIKYSDRATIFRSFVPNQAVQRQDEVLITRGAPPAVARAIQRRARSGELAKIAEGVYVRQKDRDGQAAVWACAQAAIVRRHWAPILGALVPDAVISYRSAFAGGPTEDGVVFLSHPTNFNRRITLPGLRAVLVQGPSALAGDMPIGGEHLFYASRPRQLLENLAPQRGARGKSAGAKAVEERLIAILATRRVERNSIAFATPREISQGPSVARPSSGSSTRSSALCSQRTRPAS